MALEYSLWKQKFDAFFKKIFFSSLPKKFFEDVLNLIFLSEYRFNLIIYGTEKIIVFAQSCKNIFQNYR